MKLGAVLAVLAALTLATRASHADSQDTAPSTRAVVLGAEAGVIVRYRLDAPVDRFVFADRDTIRALWTVTTPGLHLADGAISGDEPFDAFELKIAPDAAEVDRIYPGLSRIGAGYVLYGPGLKNATGQTEISFELTAGQTALPTERPVDGYAYLGPEANVARDPRGDLAAGANVDSELKTALSQAFFRSMAFYEARLGLSLPFRPVLLSSIDSPGPASFRGDVTDTGVISVRFHGDAWRGATDDVTTFVWHETFHLWNGHGVRNRDADSAPWLHEGAANMAALIGAVSTGELSETRGRAVLTTYLNGCRRALGDHDLRAATLRSGGGPYNCGALIQWMADLELRQAGTGDLFSLWAGLIGSARTHDKDFGVDEFRSALAPRSAALLVLDAPGATRWATIKDRLAVLGVRLESRPSDTDLLAAALFHVAKINCKSGSYGFFNDPGALKLDGADCGALSGEPVIDTVEGFNPQTASRAMFHAVQTRCAAGLMIRYRTRDERTLEAICDRPLIEPEIWAIAEAPPLSASG